MFDTLFRYWVYLVIGVNFFNFVASGATHHWFSAIASFSVFVGAMIVATKLDE